jgi:hypothetical protein
MTFYVASNERVLLDDARKSKWLSLAYVKSHFWTRTQVLTKTATEGNAVSGLHKKREPANTHANYDK